MAQSLPTLDAVLEKALSEGWIDRDEEAAYRKHHTDASVDVVIKSIADENSIRLNRAITAALGG